MSNDGKFREHLESSADFYSGFAGLSPRQIVVASIMEWELKERISCSITVSDDNESEGGQEHSAEAPKSSREKTLGEDSLSFSDTSIVNSEDADLQETSASVSAITQNTEVRQASAKKRVMSWDDTEDSIGRTKKSRSKSRMWTGIATER
ncbi:hypothetical protein FOZ60_014862 [Perkinsus olseni]|uniref:Uncharacterized protein n=1 Tax=Perkinsus olseni TaxID=32597 RepID=A0A7J6N734_PEROL|nr:hypothetical protein FOZ60_014862 [Perkinsus olseni]